MFRIEYRIWLNGKQYSSKYPGEGLLDGNMFSVLGKNDNGKTTLLKIVAEAFGALEEDNNIIPDSLEPDIRELFDPDNKLNYNITFTYPDNSRTVNVQFNGNDHRYKINDNPVGKTEFIDQFAVLFEVREKISDKMERHLADIKGRFEDYLTYVKRYETNLRDLYTRVNTYEKQKDLQKSAETSVDKLQLELKKRMSLKDAYDKSYRELRKEYVNYIYNVKSAELEETERKILELEKKLKQADRAKRNISPTEKKLLEICNNLRDNIYESKMLFNLLNDLELKNQFNELLKNLSGLSNLTDLSDEYLYKISSYFDRVRNYLNDQVDADIPDEKYKERQEISFLTKLLQIFREFSTADLELPGLGKKLIDLLSPLENRYNELKKHVGMQETMEAIEKKCVEFIQTIGKITVELKIYRSNMGKEKILIDNTNLDELNKEKVKAERNRDEIDRTLSKIEEEYIEIPDSEKNGFRKYSGIEEEFQQAKERCDALEKEIKNTEVQLEAQKLNAQNYKDINAPKTKLMSQDIISINNKVSKLESKFISYTGRLKDISLAKLENGGVTNEEDLIFFSKIGEYFAKVVGEIYHEHKSMRVNKIDFQKRLYIMEDGSTIKISTIGSGHSSLNAISAKMKLNFPRKKKILLIDEITDMDTDVRNLLMEEIRKQILSGESVLALLTGWVDDVPNNRFATIL